MRSITITEKNINEICGRLRKFFYNNNKTGFETWHNFDCGFKKRIDPNIEIAGEKIRNIISYPAPLSISLETSLFGSKHIIIHYTAEDSESLQIGDKIAFCGNRIMMRQKWCLSDYKYVYSVYQVKPMDLKQQKKTHMLSKMRMDAYLHDLEEDYYNS